MLNGDAVHVHYALFGERLSHGDAAALLRLVLGLANDAGLLELVEAVADVLASSHSGVLFLDTTAGLATKVLAEGLDTDLLSHVELVADSGGAGVEPVVVEGSELFVASGLNGLGPLLNIILIRTSLRESKEALKHADAHIRGLLKLTGNLRRGS